MREPFFSVVPFLATQGVRRAMYGQEEDFGAVGAQGGPPQPQAAHLPQGAAAVSPEGPPVGLGGPTGGPPLMSELERARHAAAASIMPGCPQSSLAAWTPKEHKPRKEHLEQAVKDRDPTFSVHKKSVPFLVAKLLATPPPPHPAPAAATAASNHPNQPPRS